MEKIVMIEAGANQVSNEVMLDGIGQGFEEAKKQMKMMMNQMKGRKGRFRFPMGR